MITYGLVAEEAATPGAPAAKPGEAPATKTGTEAPSGDAGKGGPGPGDGAGGGYGLLIMMGLLFALFYFMLIRPQKKKERERQKPREEMIKSLKKNDHVMTIGGLHGIVASSTEDEVVLKVDEKNDVRLRFSRDAISRVVGKDGEGGGLEKPGEKLEEKK